MGRATEALYVVTRPASEVNSELLAHIDYRTNNAEIKQLRKEVKRAQKKSRD